MTYNRQAAAAALADNPLLTDIFAQVKRDIELQFSTTPETELVDLQRRYKAAEGLEQEIINAISMYREAG